MSRKLLLLLAAASCSSAEAQPKSTPAPEALYEMDTTAQPAPAAGSALDRILKSLQVRVCVRSDVAPFGYFNDHGLAGFDIALAQQVVDQLGIDYKQSLKIEYVVVTSAERIPRLKAGACDFEVAALSYTAARAKEIGMSKVYTRSDKVLLASTKAPRPTPVIAVLEGATAPTTGVKGTTRAFRTYQDMVHAMDMGEIDYVATDRPIAEHLMRSTINGFKIDKVLAANAESYVVATPLGSDMLVAINRALDDLAQTGRLALLDRRWL
ncbi:MAG: transporter substrate-binding domain-containing protein [Kofleriaceae bacterium]